MLNFLRFSRKIPTDEIFEHCLGFLTDKSKQNIWELALKMGRRFKIDDVKETAEYYNNCTYSLDESLKELFNHKRLRPFFCKELPALLESVYARRTPPLNQGLPRRLDSIARTFSLKENEKELLFLLMLIETDEFVENIYRELCSSTYINCSSSKTVKNKPFSILLGFTSHQVVSALSSNGALTRIGLIDENHDPGAEIVQYLNGYSSRPITWEYFDEFTGKAVPLSDHIIDKKHLTTIRHIVSTSKPGQGANILFYGPPGTGKTELARTLGQHFGLKIYEIKNLEKDSSSSPDYLSSFRFRALLACQQMAEASGSLIIVDEADSMLNTAFSFFGFSVSSEKGQINRILDSSRVPIIWITNKHVDMDESTCRRFDYSVKFQKLNYDMRRRIWQSSVQKHNIKGRLDDKFIEQMADRYEVSAGGIDLALKNAARVCRSSKTRKKMPELIENILKSHLKITGRDPRAHENKQPNGGSFTLDGLNVKGNLEHTLSMLKGFNSTWDTNSRDNEIKNMNLLLHGEPGTGKTEFAKYAARLLHRRLVTRRASDLLDMYVGNSEKYIRAAFDEAQNERAILFIDEADSMFGSREFSSHSWEVSQVNELLTSMENFIGIFICSTNHKPALDRACIRRFNIKLEFDYLKPEGTLKFYERILCGLVPDSFSKHDQARLFSLSCLTPGDFKVVRQQYHFLEKGSFSHADLIKALKQEVDAKNGVKSGPLGFTGGR